MKDAARPFFNRLAEEPRVFAEYTAAYEDYCKEASRARAVAKKRRRRKRLRRKKSPWRDPARTEASGRERLDPVEGFESRFPRRCGTRSRAGSVDALRHANGCPWRKRGRTCAGWWTAACGSPPRGRRAAGETLKT